MAISYSQMAHCGRAFAGMRRECHGVPPARPLFCAENRMRTCVIFNPTAKGDKARHFRKQLDRFGAEAEFKATTHAGAARALGRVAVEEGFEVVVAAGGDGTLNEVLNGIGDAENG